MRQTQKWAHETTGIQDVFNRANIVNTEIYSVSGVRLNVDDPKSLPQGVYLLKQTDETGNVHTVKTVNVK